MALHSALTGSELHEPKGIAGASADTLYVADGAGSGAFAKIDAANVDTSSIKNVNKYKVSLVIEDLSSTAAETFFVFPEACTVTELTTVLSGAISTTDAVLTFTKQSASSLGTITIAQSGSAEGDVDSLSPVSNNTFTADQYLKVAVTTATTGALKAFITVDVTLT